MSSGLRREDWHPPRDRLATRDVWSLWRARWANLSGAVTQRGKASLAACHEASAQARPLADAALSQTIRDLSHRLRFLGTPTPGDYRTDWLTLRDQLLGHWCEMAKRVLGMFPHDTQIRAALEMHNGYMVQLAPGEGKTLAIGLTSALYASAQRPCQVITANDYLAERDAVLMQPLLATAGFTTAAITAETPPELVGQRYQADVVYATGKQLLADFLRDQIILGGEKDPTRRRLWEMQAPSAGQRPVGRGLWTAIIDEADSVLIDEATTPLIISSAQDNPLLIDAVLAGKQIFESMQQDRDYVVKTEPVVDIRFTHAGKQRIDELSYLLPRFWQFPERAQGIVSLSVMARFAYQRDRHYLVDEEGKVVIVDEKSGRVMAGRSWSHGIHQAIEAMEGLELSSPPETSARMTFQTFFNRYHRLCGASGTLQGIHGELLSTYGTLVVPLEPRVPSQLKHEPLRIFANKQDRLQAFVQEIQRSHQQGTPVLVGTRKIVDTEEISRALDALGIEHQVLNAKHHAEEAEIVRHAGRPGSVTVSTNMAGRGTDIMLQDNSHALGGLRVLMFEPHEAPRIEWQLYGRAGRQGAPGSAAGFICLLDELLVKAFGPLYERTLPTLQPFYQSPTIGLWLVRAAQWLTQWKASSQRQQLAERERTIAKQLSFSE
jgi:preprotein translocase subunit SecA